MFRFSLLWPIRFGMTVALLVLHIGILITPNLAFSQTSVTPDTALPTQIPIKDFFQNPITLEAKLSPSGRKIAISTSRGLPHVGLMVMDLDTGSRKMLASTNFDIIDFHWVGEDRLIYSVLDLTAGSGENRSTARGLYSVNTDGTKMRQLVKRKNEIRPDDAKSADRSLDWNHILLMVPKEQDGVAANEVLIGEMLFYDGEELGAIVPMWLNVRTGITRDLPLDAPPHTVEWLFDSKGQARVATTKHKGKTAVYWRAPGDKIWLKLVESDSLHRPFVPVDVDALDNLYVIHSEGDKGYSVLSRFNFDKMAPQRAPMVSTPGFDFEGALVFDHLGARVMGVRADLDAEQTIWYDEGMKQMQALTDAHLPGLVNRLSCRRCDASDMVVLVHSFSDRDPGLLSLYEAATKRWRKISEVLDNIDPSRMAAVDFQRIKARDGRDLPIWLTLPVGLKPNQAAPAIVLVHGGPWVREGHWRWQAFEQFLASRGYLVISPEFRGSTGYGDDHYRAGWKQWGQAMQDDVADALLWAQAQGLASNKACIAGASYGGYATLMGLVRDPTLYRCGVAWLAVTDPFLFLQGGWGVEDDLKGQARSHDLPLLVGDAQKDVAMLSAASPLLQAKRIVAPLLLAYGKEDLRVPIAHGERLRDALRKAGHPPDWVEYEKEGHGWQKVSTQVDFARRVEQFLDKHLKNAQP